MLIKDTNGKYELKVDANRGVIYEKNIDFWKEEDFVRFHNEYITKIYPLIKGKKWVKCSDLRAYKTSNIVDSLNGHLKWCKDNGFVGGAIILDSAIVKMQISRSSKSLGIEPVPFDNLEEADKWLKSQGF